MIKKAAAFLCGENWNFQKYKALASLLNVECKYTSSRRWFVKDRPVVRRIAYL